MVGRSVVPRNRHLRFTYLALVEMLLCIALLTGLRALTMAAFVTLSFFLLLLTAALTSPLAVVPAWRSRLRWVLGGWFLLFVYVIVRRVQLLLNGSL